MAQFGNADAGFFANSQTTVGCQFITCCTINQCGVIIPDSGCCSSVRCGASNCASGGYSATLGGLSNTSSGLYSAIVGGQLNNTCGFANSFIVGSNLCATQACTTFTNCLSANNLTTGCFVCVGANKVLENSLLPTPSYGLYAQTALSTAITNTTVESSLIGSGVGTLTVPANAFKVGDSFVAKLCGNLNSANLETIHIRVKSDGIVIADAGVFSLNLATNQHFELSIDFTIAAIGGAGVASLFVNGQFSYNKNANNNIDGVNFALIDDTVFSTIVPNVLSITAQWGSAKVANLIQTQNFVLTKVY